MVKITNIIEFLESSSNRKLDLEEGILFGKSNKIVNIILVCWMADIAAIKYAIKIKADLIITHESLFYPILLNHRISPYVHLLSWNVNHDRAILLAKNNIAVLRGHTTIDELCIFDEFANNLELGKPIINEPGFIKIYKIKPITCKDLISKVKKSMNLEVVRVGKGDINRIVQKIGLPWGGLGLSENVSYMQKLVEHGCEVFIVGESDNFGFRFAQDSGVFIIETSHEISENIGLKHFAKILENKFLKIEVVFFENNIPWNYL